MTRVLVTGAGGAAGVSVIRALLADGVAPVAGDPDPLAAGRHLVDERIVLPYATDAGFARSLVRAATAATVDAVICTVAEEMAPLAAVAPDLEAAGIAIWLPPVEAVGTCIDKERFAAVVAGAGLPAPVTRAAARTACPDRGWSSPASDEGLDPSGRWTTRPTCRARCAGRRIPWCRRAAPAGSSPSMRLPIAMDQ